MRAALPGGRRRGRGLRGRREEDAAAATDPARARRPQHSALSVPQQDRQGRDQGDGGAGDPAAGVAQAAGDAPAADPAERHRHRLRRSRAGARPCLPGARAVRSGAAGGRKPRPQQGRALLHAGEAGRPRRRADGAIAGGHSAAARQGVRRPRQGIARRPGGAGADGRRDADQRRAAPAQGASPRGAERAKRPPSASASTATSRSPMC